MTTTTTYYYPATNPPPVACAEVACGGMGGLLVGVMVFLVWGRFLVLCMRRGHCWGA